LGTLVLRTERQSVWRTRAPECQKLKIDQYGAETFEQQQFGTAGNEGVKHYIVLYIGLLWLYA